jgi:hypothetical protein
VVYVEAHGTRIALDAGHEGITIGQKPVPGNSKSGSMSIRSASYMQAGKSVLLSASFQNRRQSGNLHRVRAGICLRLAAPS